MTKSQIERMVRHVFEEFRRHDLITYKVAEDKTFRRAVELIEKEFDSEIELDRECHRMVDDLEKQNPNGFERHKMFQMIKRKLAEKKGIIL
jgi:hypothetical protein